MSCPICGGASTGKSICGSQECREFILKMASDPVFFFEKCLILRHRGGVPQMFVLQDWQREFLVYCKEQLDKGESIRAVVQKGRRVGFSALMSGFHIWYISFRAAYDQEDKYWDIISASHPQAKKLFKTGKRMVTWNPILYNAIKRERNGVLKLGETEMTMVNENETIEGSITALSSGGATKRGRDPSGQTFDEAAQIKDSDFNDLDISSMAGDDHQIVGSTPYDDFGFFYEIIHGESDEYKKFIVSTATLNAEGMNFLEQGERKKIKLEHITKVVGWRVTKQKILKRIHKYDTVTTKREILGMFVSGEELYYPSKILKASVDYDRELFDLVYDPRSVVDDVLAMYSNTIQIIIGVDMAGKGNDKTCVTVWALQPDGAAHMVYWESWFRMKYNNQYDEIKRISNCFTNSAMGRPLIMVDSTGTQDSNVDSLENLDLDVKGVVFTPGKKESMAKIMFEYLMRGKDTDQEFFSIGYDEVMYKEIISVKSNYKGEGGHLGDWVASMWCALSDQTVLSGISEVEYDEECSENISDAVALNKQF